MSTKSVLGDDPFAGPRPPRDGGPAAGAEDSRPGAEESAAPTSRPGKQRSRRRAGGRAAGGDQRAAASRAEATAGGASETAAPARPQAAPPLEDGAAARRAARVTSRLETAPPGASAGGSGGSYPHVGAQPGSRVSPERRPITHTLQISPARAAGVLQRTAQAYTRWISELRMRDRSDTVDEFGFDPVFAARWRPMLEFLYRSYWRVETSGIENIPDRDQAMIVANHAGTFPYDGAMIMSAVKYDHPAHRDVRPLVEDFIFHFPFIGVALNRIGCVRACPENAERLLRHGGLVAVFPEGIKGIGKLFSQRYQLQRFGRGGFVKLALQTRTPIIPAAVIGAEEIHPMLGRVTWLAKYIGIPYVPLTPTFPWLGPLGTIPLPTKWQIRFGEPLDFASQLGPAAAQDHVLVNRLTEQVRSTIQSMVDEALLGRRSILFG